MHGEEEKKIFMPACLPGCLPRKDPPAPNGSRKGPTHQKFSVVAPARAQDARLHLVLGHARLLLAPEAKIRSGARRELVRRRIVANL